MAEGGYEPRHEHKNRSKYNQVCRYFLHGACRKGEDCLFVHIKSNNLPVDNVCKYYLMGNCFYGQKCRYDHVKTGRHQNEMNSLPSGIPPKENTKVSHQQISPSKMVTLKKRASGGNTKISSKNNPISEKWVKARDFVPGQKYYGAVSYADAVQPTLATKSPECKPSNNFFEEGLCPYYATGECPYEDKCVYIHGEICDYCGMPRLHPTDESQREQHIKECVAEHEKAMEVAFAIQHSIDKECGICLENVMKKDNFKPSNRFGILENCNHCFCLACIRQWRNNKNSSIETHRACPVCRTHSDFVTPSKYWVDCPDEKKKVINEYKISLSQKPCHYFKQGKGECPFNSKCFYRHALPDGQVVANNIIQRRRRENADGDSIFDEDSILWEFVSRRDENGLSRDLSLEEDIYRFLFQEFDSDVSDDDDNNNSILRYSIAQSFMFADTDSDFDIN